MVWLGFTPEPKRKREISSRVTPRWFYLVILAFLLYALSNNDGKEGKPDPLSTFEEGTDLKGFSDKLFPKQTP
jgi:hypothetical protein